MDIDRADQGDFGVFLVKQQREFGAAQNRTISFVILDDVDETLACFIFKNTDTEFIKNDFVDFGFMSVIGYNDLDPVFS